MGKLDEIYIEESPVSDDGAAGPRRRTVEEILREEDGILADTAMRTRLDDIIEGRKLHIAQQRQERLAIEQGKAGAASSAGSPASESVINGILTTMIKAGVDPDKAAEFLKVLKPDDLAKLALMNGQNPAGLAPFFWASKQESITIHDMIDLFDRYAERGNQGGTISDLIDAAVKLKEMGSDSSSGALYEKLDQLTEQLHQNQLTNQKELADMRAKQIEGELAVVRNELNQLKVAQNTQPKSLLDQLKEVKATASELGWVAGPAAGAAAAKGLDVERLVEKVLDSKAADKLADAGADALRGRVRGPPAAGGAPRASGRQILCNTCLSRGQRTMLTVTDEMNAGKAPLKCEVCGTVYEKK